MNIDELQKEVDALESRLQDFISRELDNFSHDTGVCIKRVNVDLYGFGVVGEKREKYILNRVSCEIAF